MSHDLLNWLLGVVETHPEGLSAESVATVRERLEKEVGNIVRREIEAAKREQTKRLVEDEMLRQVRQAKPNFIPPTTVMTDSMCGAMTTNSAFIQAVLTTDEKVL